MLIAWDHFRHEFNNLLIVFDFEHSLCMVVKEILEQVFDDLLLLSQVSCQHSLFGYKWQNMVRCDLGGGAQAP